MARKKTSKPSPAVQPPTQEKAKRAYEMVVVFNPQISQERLEKDLKDIQSMIQDGGGSLTYAENWGTRRLAYPISHFSEGKYVLQRFESPPNLPKTLETRFHLDENVIRYLFINLDE